MVNDKTKVRTEDMIQKYFLTGGTNTAYTVSVPYFVQYGENIGIDICIHTSNGETPTININGLGVKNILDNQGNPVAIGELVQGGFYNLAFDGDNMVVSNKTLVLEDTVINTNQTKVPTVNLLNTGVEAAKSYADSLVTSVFNDRGNYDASGNEYPSTGGSGTEGAIRKGNIWTISVVGTLGGVAVGLGDSVRALVNNPGQTTANRVVSENNIGYVPENSTNKVQSMSGYTTNTVVYLSAKAIYDWATGLFIQLSKIVTSWTGIPLDVNIPSEKLVKDTLDTKLSKTGVETMTNKTMDDALTTQQIAKPSNPAAGYLKIYAKTDGFYYLDSAGVETKVGSGGGGGGSSFWAVVPGTPTRLTNTSFTLTDTGNAGLYNLLLSRGVVIRRTESGVLRQAMITGATYLSNVVTVTIMGDIMASLDVSSMKYFNEKARVYNLAVAGTIGATGTNVANTIMCEVASKIYGADMRAGTAGNGTTTIDINKNGTTVFTAKPSILTTAQSGLGFTADTPAVTAVGDYITLDIDAVAATTKIIDLYVNLYYMPLYNTYLS